MRKLLNMAAAVAVSTFGLSLAATPASAGVVTLLQPNCNVYDLSTGCLFSWDPPPGNIFEDPVAIVDAYNATHAASPAPEDLPALNFLGKSEGANAYTTINGNDWTFTNLPFLVSFYTVKQAGDYFILFGLETPTNSFTAVNTQIEQPGISHVAFFGAPGAIPEPATWAMMIGGFGAVGTMLRRRRAATA